MSPVTLDADWVALGAGAMLVLGCFIGYALRSLRSQEVTLARKVHVSEDRTEFDIKPDAHGVSVIVSQNGERLGTVIADSCEGSVSVLVFDLDDEDEPLRVDLGQ